MALDLGKIWDFANSLLVAGDEFVPKLNSMIIQ